MRANFIVRNYEICKRATIYNMLVFLKMDKGKKKFCNFLPLDLYIKAKLQHCKIIEPLPNTHIRRTCLGPKTVNVARKHLSG